MKAGALARFLQGVDSRLRNRYLYGEPERRAAAPGPKIVSQNEEQR